MTAAISPVTLAVENAYDCGRESQSVELVPPPRSHAEFDVEEWWDTEAHDATGDGHPCGSVDHALYEVTVLQAPDFPELVGEKRSWEG